MLKQFEMALQWLSKAFTFMQFEMAQQWLNKAYTFLQFVMAQEWLSKASTFLQFVIASTAFNFLVEKLDLYGKAIEQISYMWNCSEKIEDFKKENEKLSQMLGRVQQKITEAQLEAATLLKGVDEWVTKAESQISNAEVIVEFEANANKTWFTRYRYGKKAANKATSLSEHQKEVKNFESCVSVPTPAPRVLGSYVGQNIDDLETHKLCFEEIIKSLKDDDKQIIGIYGTGGVGKTTLAKEVALEVKSLNLFDAVEFITVSQPVDAKMIKEEVGTAATRIENGEKILVILDDLWGELKLDEVGIPCVTNYKKSKILLTSRSEDVCKTMKATCLINVGSLKPKEAWTLFKRVVGDRVETDKKLKEIAEKVVDGCGGLPLIIQVVGASLKNESIESWKRALTQLQRRTTSYIDPNIRLAYSHLQLSYDFLESEEAKSCFLLCSMFPEDYNIPLVHLAHYGVGLEIFEDLDSMEDARNRVRHAVKILKSTCLLLDGCNDSRVKMHDVVREVALLIASKGSNKFLVKAGIGLTEWQPRTKRVKSCTGISLMENRMRKLPDYELEIPLLDIFLIQGNRYLSTISDKFILGLKEARVLDFGDIGIRSLPPSLQQLTKLCMLNLGWNQSLRDIRILGVLKSLEILILSYTGINEIPQQIGDLVNLRQLEVKGCRTLSHIAPNVISKLRWLEELHISYYPVLYGNHDFLLEIGELSMLTFLDLFVPNMHLIPPTDGVCFKKLKGFVIQIGGRKPVYHSTTELVHKKTLIRKMEDFYTPSMSEVKELIKLSDGIIFESVENPNIVPATMCCESLDDLTTIMLSGCPNLSSLVEYSNNSEVDEEELGGGENTKKQFFSKLEHLFLFGLDMLHVLWDCRLDQYISLKNLVTLNIAYCNKLERLFSVNVARRLVNLQTLTIQGCQSLEEVICDGDEGGIDMVVFHCLIKLELISLRYLKRFCAGKVIIRCPSLVIVNVKGCNRMETYDTPDLKLVNQQTDESESYDFDQFTCEMVDWNVYEDQIEQAFGLRDSYRAN